MALLNFDAEPYMQIPPWEPSRPQVLEVIAENIPEELKRSPRWVVWKAERRADGKITKPPYQARNPHLPASTTNARHLADFETALKACRECDDVAGIGYVVMPGDGLVFIDMDDCMEDGEPNADAQAAINAFSSYAERSPSGNGVRVVVRGVISDDFTNQSIGREMYAGGGTRYLTITGQVLDALDSIEESQEALDHYYPQWATRKNAARSWDEIPATVASSVDLSGVSEFTLSVIQGDYDVYDGDRSKALLGVCKDMIRAGYSTAEILRVASHPDYPIAQAALERRRGDMSSAAEWVAKYTLPEAKAAVDSEPKIDFEALIRSATRISPEPEQEAEAPKAMPYPPGLAGELAAEILANAIRPQPLFAISGALMTLSLVSQNYYRCAYMGGAVNLYMVQVGGTASGKDGPRKAIKEILDAIGLAGLLPESIASGPALLRALGKQQPVCYAPDEFGLMLQTALNDKGSTHQKDLVSEIMRLYSLGDSFHGGKHYADDANNIEQIVRPYLCLFGSTTPTELTTALSQSQIDNGFLNRILYIETDLEKPAKNREAKPGFKPVTLERLRRLYSHAQGIPASVYQPRVIAVKDDARRLLDAFDDECDSRVEGEMGPLWVRAHENAVRVAGCVALGMPEAIVTREVAQWATDFVSWCVRSMISRLGEDMSSSPFEADAKRCLRFIRQAKKYTNDAAFGDVCALGVMPRSKLMKLMKLSSKSLDQVLDYLLGTGELKRGELETGRKRKTPVYALADSVPGIEE